MQGGHFVMLVISVLHIMKRCHFGSSLKHVLNYGHINKGITVLQTHGN